MVGWLHIMKERHTLKVKALIYITSQIHPGRLHEPQVQVINPSRNWFAISKMMEGLVSPKQQYMM
jgi:hypothetical protein